MSEYATLRFDCTAYNLKSQDPLNCADWLIDNIFCYSSVREITT